MKEKGSPGHGNLKMSAYQQKLIKEKREVFYEKDDLGIVFFINGLNAVLAGYGSGRGHH
jgi:hypothetical protein